MESFRTTPMQWGAFSAYCCTPNQWEPCSRSHAQNLVLTESQAACLVALRRRTDSQPKIAIETKLALAKTASALRALARLGLAEDDQTKRWHATLRGKSCHFETVPDRGRRNNVLPEPSGRRLLELLDRPMRGREIAEKLQITRQRVRELLIKLHALGCVNFGDLRDPSWIAMRAGDKTCLLSRDEERVLSAIPREYATDATKIRLAARMPEIKAQQILGRLLIRRFIEVSDGSRGNRVYRITITGSKHPQYSQSARRAQAPRLPVESDRIRQVLSAILDSGELRIRDVSTALRIANPSMNALMQCLKRKRLVKKSGQQLHSPYSLTAQGLAALAEMTRRQAV